MPTKPAYQIIKGTIIDATHMTDLMDYYNEIWAGGTYSYDGNHSSTTDDRRFGWGQAPATLTPTPVTGVLITADVFNQAMAQVNAGQYHISDIPGNLLIKLAETGTKILDIRPPNPENAYQHYNDILAKIENLQNNKYAVDWSDWDKDRLVSLNTQAWDDDLSIVHKFSFTDYNEARHFFNSGGELTLELEMDPGGPPGNDVWRQVFNQFDSIRIGAENCRVVADNVYDILSTSTVNPKGFYNGIVYGQEFSTILDAGVFKFAGAQGEYEYAYVYVYSEYNSRRIQLQIKADELGGTFNVYVRVNLIEDEDDTFAITQPIKLYSGWVNPTQAPTAGDGNESYMTANGGTIYRFAERTAPIITEETAWNKVDLASGMQLDAGLNDDWTGTQLLNVPAGHFEIGKEYTIVSVNHEIPATRIETGETYKIKTIGTTDFTKLGAANNNIGTVFTATLTDDTTGTVTLSTATDTNFTLIGAANNLVGTTFTALGIGTGAGRADEVSLTNTDPGIEWTKESARYYKNVRPTDPVTESYSLATTASTVNESGTFTIALSTTGIANGTTLPYTITGIESADISNASLTGNFIVGTTDNITFVVTADGLSEGAETFVIALDNGEASGSVVINDTSQSVVTPGYSLAVDNASVNEGGTFKITLTAFNVPANTLVPYTITGVDSADIGGVSLTGNFETGTAGLEQTFTVTEDATILEGDETFTLTIDGTTVNVNVLITDSSVKVWELRDIFNDVYSTINQGPILITTTHIDTRINAIESIRQAAVAQSVSASNYNTMVTAFVNDNTTLFASVYSSLTTAQQTAIVAGIMPLVNNDFELMNVSSKNTNYGSAYPTNYTADLTGIGNYLAFYINNQAAVDADILAFSNSLYRLGIGNQAILNYIDDRDTPIAPTTPVSSNFWTY